MIFIVDGCSIFSIIKKGLIRIVLKKEKGGTVMFNNIGKKIKTLTVVCFVLVLIGVVVYGVVLMVTLRRQAWIGLLVIAGGFLACWISSFFLYGFGELIESSEKTAENTSLLLQKLKAPAKNVPASSSSFVKSAGNTEETWTCQYCDYKNPTVTSFCRNCQRSRY